MSMFSVYHVIFDKIAGNDRTKSGENANSTT